MKGNYTIGWANTSIHRNLQVLFSRKLKDLDIKIGQCDFFYIISENEGITQKKISEQLYISKSTVAKAVKILVNKGYIEKRKDKNDNRIEHLYLTDSGKKVAPIVKQIFIENMIVAEHGLTEDEVNVLMILMKKVLYNIVEENVSHNNK